MTLRRGGKELMQGKYVAPMGRCPNVRVRLPSHPNRCTPIPCACTGHAQLAWEAISPERDTAGCTTTPRAPSPPLFVAKAQGKGHAEAIGPGGLGEHQPGATQRCPGGRSMGGGGSDDPEVLPPRLPIPTGPTQRPTQDASPATASAPALPPQTPLSQLL